MMLSNLKKGYFDLKVHNKIIRIYFICHRLPDRCLIIGGRRMPLCARCSGITLGTVISLPVIYQFIPDIVMLFLLSFLSLPAVLDGFRQLYGKLSNNGVRLTTGLLAGVALVSLARLLRLLIMGV